MSDEERENWVLGAILTQYSLKRGLKLFGADATKSATKELKQHHDLATILPLDPSKLTPEQRAKAVSSLLFLKKKRDGELKSRMCANGSKQRTYDGYDKNDAASPTAATESVFITGVIDALEGRAVAILDLPGAFLHCDNDEMIVMALEGALAEMMVMVDPKLYRKHITTNSRGKPVLYVQCAKAVYGLLRSALIFYRKLVADLEAYGFEICPYDPCVMTKEVAGSQMTVVFHVDDLKVSHASEFEITRLANYLKDEYGKVKVSRGRKHDFLGMDLDFNAVPDAMQVSMIPYLNGMLRKFPEELKGSASTPAADHLFKVRPENEATYLPEEMAQVFHRTTAQLLFVAQRARRDIQTAVSFLTTRVKRPDEDDWGKLRRVLLYLKGTLSLKLTLKAEDLSAVRWWIDASYAVHEDCKGHTGATMTLGSEGNGACTSGSWKQKLQGRSSTENELIAVHDVLPQVLWSRHFIESLGYTVEQNIIFQDNKSAILLETNGTASSSKRTKHIKSRYFYVKDCVERGEVEIEHCPTEEMWCDVLTKPKQGIGFKRDRAAIMGCSVDWEDDGSGGDAGMVLNREVSNGDGPASTTTGGGESPKPFSGDPSGRKVRWSSSVKRQKQRLGRGRLYLRTSPQECVDGMPKQ